MGIEKAITRRILFIDDDRSGREVALFNLRKAGYDVTPASDGQEGLALFSPEKFDLVVTDLKMPVVDGMEVLETVRRISPETPDREVRAAARCLNLGKQFTAPGYSSSRSA